MIFCDFCGITCFDIVLTKQLVAMPPASRSPVGDSGERGQGAPETA